MQARSLCTVVLLASSATFACAGGEVGGDGGFTTANTNTTNDSTTNNNESGEDESTTRDDETGHNEETADTDDPPPPPDPTCDDGEQNQGETDIDCGGPNCDPCGDGQACVDDSDCETQSCVGSVCIVPSCTDGVQNGGETGVDCGGGVCGACGDNQGCLGPADCQSGVCVDSVCIAPNCGDTVQNGNETDVDCGGGDPCMGCAEGQSCNGDSDCLSQYCTGGQCAAAECLSNPDCASFNSQCTTGVCTPEKTCVAQPFNNGSSCNDGDNCTTAEVCSNGTCGGGNPVNCSNLSNACNLGVCNPNDGSCYAQPANNGNPCNDGNACTVGEVCNAGTCVDPNAPGYVFYETFANNNAGWTLGPEWGIGAAAASNCAISCPGNDPATDHTPTGDNGLAGVVIGGCASTNIHGDYCLTSPPINTSNLASVWLTYWRHLHTDYPSFMTSSVAVFNGVSWTAVWVQPNNGACINDVAWTQMAHNITNYKAANMQVRFCFNVGAGGAYTSGQWSVDDVVIGPAQCTP